MELANKFLKSKRYTSGQGFYGVSVNFSISDIWITFMDRWSGSKKETIKRLRHYMRNKKITDFKLNKYNQVILFDNVKENEKTINTIQIQE